MAIVLKQSSVFDLVQVSAKPTVEHSVAGIWQQLSLLPPPRPPVHFLEDLTLTELSLTPDDKSSPDKKAQAVAQPIAPR